jgi:zinc transport system substrate-binding protein
MILMFNPRVAAALPVVLLAGLASCTAGETDDDRLDVVVSIYPLQYAVEQIGGDVVDITTVTPAGTDPHSVELSPRQLRSFSEADVVVYLSGFQAAVDDAVAQRDPAVLLDVATAADLRPLPQGAADEAAGEQDEGDALDPHFWLDPTRLAAVGHEIARVLGEADPDNADAYAERADAFEADLTALDTELSEGLADCGSDILVTSHAAFGYLTDRYGLQQLTVSGIDPEGEPSPARIREVRDQVADLGVTGVFTEPLADPAVAAALADDLDVEVGELDPLDSHTDGPDYREIMESNLAALRSGLGCA